MMAAAEDEAKERRPLTPEEAVELVARLGTPAEVAGFARQVGPVRLARMALAQLEADRVADG